MRYISTRGQAPSLPFDDVLIAGLAADGGLYVPERWPTFSEAGFRALVGRPYEQVATAVLSPFVAGALSEEELSGAVAAAYGAFGHRAVAPLVELDAGDWLLELFHGPTLAFKDVAMQLLARLMDIVLKRRGERVTIVGATSGDTGSAAIEAFRGLDSVDIFILHPHGRVSEVQRRQMTTVDAPNVHNLAIEGTFDDCQSMLKAMFADREFSQGCHLAGVNSINWARIMAQTVYYVTSALALGAPDRRVSFTVPTGNFGDIFAGYVAKRMGLPIDRLAVATNVNDILHRALTTGRYETDKVVATSSPSMDIQVSSNFERLLFDAYGRDAEAVTGLMAGLAQSGAFTITETALDRILADFSSGRADEETVARTIAETLKETRELVDPHTAVGLAVARALERDPAVPMVTLATAHPAKFPDAVEAACGVRPELPESLSTLLDKPEHCTTLDNDPEAVKAFIAARSRAGREVA
ncbi:threonine synthase [Kaustia mangrovi]|uniref:Threonine synthase n=1 Tax=Kaustia mangrovi TaxID=2593653 RepID=A0A7S8HE02_9HYPH|nr:threonine synthase [Kaustia mangrovi]QPC45196.1 threonine synthase [Kaustia mangrovi]